MELRLKVMQVVLEISELDHATLGSASAAKSSACELGFVIDKRKSFCW